MKQRMTILTIGMAILVVVATLLTAQFQPKPFDIGDYSHVDIAEAEAEFEQTKTNDSLVYLCKALSWRAEVAGEEGAREKLRYYGQLLLDRAKEEMIDLEHADDPDVMLAVLRVIRETGAR